MEKKHQWYVITATSGKEDSILQTLIEKISNFGYTDSVSKFEIFKKTVAKEDIFKPTDANLPKSLKNTKTTKWETLPDGTYKRIKSKVVNIFPGYIFVKMEMFPEIWYCIRNTNGVLGFLGSSGKGTMPIPISEAEYLKMKAKKDTYDEQYNKLMTNQVSENNETIKIEEKQNIAFNYKVGSFVNIKSGPFANTSGVIKAINMNNQTAIIEVDFLNRKTECEIDFINLVDEKNTDEQTE